MASQQPRRFYFLSHPRTASNLLLRILNIPEQPDVASCKLDGYFFLEAVRVTNEACLRDKHLQEWSEDGRALAFRTYQEGFDQFQEYLDSAETKGKIAVVKEHSAFILEPVQSTKFTFPNESVAEEPWTVGVPEDKYGPKPPRTEGNDTLFPDAVLDTLKPVFLIRHPALTFPSFFRVRYTVAPAEERAQYHKTKGLAPFMTFSASRRLFDWYAQRMGKTEGDTYPIILDADDVINTPEVVVKLADMMGLDKSKLQFEWDAMSAEKTTDALGPVHGQMLMSLATSNGIRKDKLASNIDIDVEANKWKEEWGEDAAEAIKKWVNDAMPDYEYMKGKRLTVPPTA